ncbi:MFS transporter [Alicyclobacillus sp. SO9]|nr:MFS transporter [Alicyclobacillus sp. SO9]
MISVALARIQQDFHLTFTTSSWLISSYYLTSAISQPVMGKIADVFGRKRVFITGLLLVALSSVTAPYSPTFGWLITLRLIQSLGSGALYPAGMGIVRHQITERQAQALALLSVFASGAAAFGPSLGGIVMHWGDWPAIFWVNIPFIIASVSMALFFLPRDAKSVTGAEEKKSSLLKTVILRLDLFGIGVFAGGIVASLVFLLTLANSMHPLTGVLAVALIGVFIWWETRSKLPFIDLRMLTKNMSLTWVLIQFVTVNIIFYSIFFGIPTYLQDVRHFNPQDTGFIMLAVAGFSVIVSPLTGRWVERSGSRPPLLLAGLCLTVGSILFVTVHSQSPVWWLVIILSTLGLSNGFNNVGLQTALFRVTPQEVISTASGLFQMSRYLGTILSTVLLGLMFGNRLSTLELRHLGLILAIFGILVIGMSWRLPRKA